LVGHDVYNAGTSKGAEKFFSILKLTEEFVVKCLGEFGMDTGTMKKLFLEEDGVLFLMVIKSIS